MTVSYPRLAARTLRFTLGVPRNLTVSPDGSTVRFVRTPDGVTRTGQLWELDVDSGRESLLVDPAALLDGDEQLSAAERSRRERSRESAAGVVSYDVDATGTTACFPLSGRLWTVDLGSGSVGALPSIDGVIDPRLDPTGRRIAYAAGRALRVIDVDGGGDRDLVAAEPADTVTWGQADFLAAEEMERYRGFWWAPDGERLLVQRTDEAQVQTWHVSDPEHPERTPVAQRYPSAGTPNPEVSLWVVGLDGTRTEVVWDHDAFEYLARVSWTTAGDPVVQVLSRDQRSSQILTVDPATGATRVLRELADPAWVELSATPRLTPDGRLVSVEDVAGHRRVLVDGEPISPDPWQVRGVVAVLADCVVATASAEPTEIQVVRFGLDGTTTEVTQGAAVHGAVMRAGTTVISRSGLDAVGTTVTAHRDGTTPRLLDVVAEPAPFEPDVHLIRGGEHDLSIAVLLPRDRPRQARLPVLMDPYGGPHAQRVLASARMFLEAQWLADQGFCVVIADGRGTPGRGPDWEKAVQDDFAGVTLDDQVEALGAVAAAFGDDVDTSRVGITGWSYGGYLSALAVLERPDVFHAAVAGAPVTEWRLYDTCYTERYLGDPTTQPEVYDANSLLPRAANLERPLMLIHGLADDNVVAAHTLQLSSALLAAGRPHTVLPLSGVTHMTPQETVAENLKLLQVAFLTEHLGA